MDIRGDGLTFDIIFQASSNKFADFSKLGVLGPVANRDLVVAG
jgi:hypothetical protein